MTDVITLGQWIKQRRTQLNLSPSECAKRANMELPVWSNWENDRSRRKDGRPAEPRGKTASNIAAALSVPVEDVLQASGIAMRPQKSDPELARYIVNAEKRVPEESRMKFRQLAKQQVDLLASALSP